MEMTSAIKMKKKLFNAGGQTRMISSQGGNNLNNTILHSATQYINKTFSLIPRLSKLEIADASGYNRLGVTHK